MPDATFTCPDLTSFTRLDDLGLEVTGQLLAPGRAVLACRVVEPDDWCRRYGCRDGTGPARLLDMVEGRTKKAFASWLTERDQDWRDWVEVVAMDGFSGFKSATTEQLPDTVSSR